jgi:glycosyl transferase family 25
MPDTNYVYLPLDDSFFDHGMDVFLKQDAEKVSWEQRSNQLCWRGVCSGGGLNSVRMKFVEAVHAYDHDNDVKICRKWIEGQNLPEHLFACPNRDRIDYREFFKYKIFFIVDGNVIASNHMYGFGSGCVPFLISNGICWFSHLLEPFVHYVPVKYDLSDLVEKLEWVKNNDGKAEVVANNALAFSRLYFSAAYQRKHIEESLRKHHTIYNTCRLETYLPHIFYINLDKRKDRLAEIKNELQRYNLHAERFAAIEKEMGSLGCSMSHLAVLKIARERDYPYVLILEDDFTFLVSPQQFEQEIRNFFTSNIPFDVLMVSYNVLRFEATEHPCVQKVIEAQTASGYIVHRKFYDTLIALYEESVLLHESTRMDWIYANDQIWKRLQPTSQWYALTTRCGKQRAGYSDNAKEFRSYVV